MGGWFVHVELVSFVFHSERDPSYCLLEASMSCRSTFVGVGPLEEEGAEGWSAKVVVTSILIAFSASSWAMRCFFWRSATRHCLKYFT